MYVYMFTYMYTSLHKGKKLIILTIARELNNA